MECVVPLLVWSAHIASVEDAVKFTSCGVLTCKISWRPLEISRDEKSSTSTFAEEVRKHLCAFSVRGIQIEIDQYFPLPSERSAVETDADVAHFLFELSNFRPAEQSVSICWHALSAGRMFDQPSNQRLSCVDSNPCVERLMV